MSSTLFAPASSSPELSYVLLILGLFLVPRMLQRFRLPGAITTVALGAAANIGLGWFQGDTTIQWLGTLGIVALFLFAGLEVDFDELRQGARVVTQHVLLQTGILLLAAVASAALLGLADRPATLLALALFTPSTGFIFDSLGSFGLDTEQRFWVKSKAIASEIVALAILFLTIQSSDTRTLVTSSAALVALVALLPWLFRAFSENILPHAPRSEFTFLVIVAMLSAYLTRRLGVYYLVGAFVVGITAVRMRAALPGLVTEKVLGAVELFAAFFVPFYFFKAGLHLHASDFSRQGIGLGLIFLAVAVPLRVGTVALHRRIALGEPLRSGAKVGVSLVPTLVFTMVLAEILRERYAVSSTIFSALIVFALGNTLLPGLILRARLEFEGSGDETGDGPSESSGHDPMLPGSASEVGGATEGASPGGVQPESASAVAGRDRASSRRARLQSALFRAMTDGNETHETVLSRRIEWMRRGRGRHAIEVASSALLGSLALTLDSKPLLIAATLASPLVAPFGGLSLGLATGSPTLVVQTLLRGLSSAIAFVFVAAAMARLLPFDTMSAALQQTNFPTLLDLVAAGICAILVVHSELRPTATALRAAARVAFGHVLVLPLAAAGHAVAAGNWPALARTGTTALANVVATVAFGLVGFVAVGMHHTNVESVEERLETPTSSSDFMSVPVGALRRVFASRWGGATRLLLPLAIIAAAAVPLGTTLDAVAAELRAREAVRTVVATLDATVLETRVDVGPSTLRVELVVLGADDIARRARERVEAGLRSRTRRQLVVTAIAVPDASSLAVLAGEISAMGERTPPTIEVLARIVRSARSHLEGARDPLLQVIDVRASADDGGYRLDVVTFGPPPDASLGGSLERAVGDDIAETVEARIRHYDSATVTLDPADPASIVMVTTFLRDAQDVSGLRVCATVAPTPTRTRTRHTDVVAGAWLARIPGIEIREGESHTVRYARGSCGPEGTGDAGVP